MIIDLATLLEQEQELQFTDFDYESAWELGSLLRHNATKRNASVAIDITLNGHCLFSSAMPDTSIDNIEWIKRKKNVVHRYQHSSWYMGQYYKTKGKNITEASLVDATQFAPYGGSFPLTIKGVDVVGSITVSGLPQYEDHLMVVETLSEFIQRYQK
ncbi:heme-degrading domain-containing protein [Photobacterium profundum]|uniref:UPF0303 protein PBPRB1633 n=1 Tax=Photobacterium profundum (strain SS9) TaxID=298386 RepID=Q6LGT7_PHOPR|nr:heme-degrading domain-containing protein [Photobacterium profundum]CAG23493.1 conserved hypothetical protein [Photobacterium profundum SS9]